MALGATIDFEAGNVKRAPEIFSKVSFRMVIQISKRPQATIQSATLSMICNFFLLFHQTIVGSIQKSVRQIDFFVCETVYRLMLLEIL